MIYINPNNKITWQEGKKTEIRPYKEGLLDIVRGDLIIKYNKGNIFTSDYYPKETSYIKGGVFIEFGIGGSIDDENCVFATNLAMRGFPARTFNMPSTGAKKISDGNFNLEDTQNASDAVYKDLKTKFQKNLYI